VIDRDARIEFRREPISSLALLAEEWQSLERISSPSFFLSWHWIGTFLEALPEAARPQLLRGSRHSETVALALCGYAIRRRAKGFIRSRAFSINETGQSCFDCITIEHNSFLARAGLETAVMASAVEWFAGLRGEVDELRLAGSFLRFPRFSLGDLHCYERSVPSYSLNLNQLIETNGQVSRILSSNARQQLRQSIRAYAARGPLRLQRARTLGEALAFFQELKALHCQSWDRRGKRHAFTQAFFEDFHTLLIRKTFQENIVELSRVTAGDHLLGVLYNFRFGEWVYAYQSGFASADGRQRPGMIAHALAIQHACQAGARVYDFMAGPNRVKQRFSTCCIPMLWQTIEHPKIAFRLERLARRFRAKLTTQRLQLSTGGSPYHDPNECITRMWKRVVQETGGPR
jgi:CelD/BcsL family acetyltransferase involved in cellulose biosynthesis